MKTHNVPGLLSAGHRRGGWMDGGMHGWMDGWIDGWMDGRVDGWTSSHALNVSHGRHRVSTRGPYSLDTQGTSTMD